MDPFIILVAIIILIQTLLYIRKRFFTSIGATTNDINSMLSGSHDVIAFCQYYHGIISTKGTPHIIVDCSYSGVVVPESSINIETQEIILNIAPEAIQGFKFQNNTLQFSAKFDSNAFELVIPFAAIKKIYGYELGAGIILVHE